MTADLVGQTLGQYQLKEKIGAGGLAVVYKAYQPALERWAAVKVLHYQDRETLIRFQREAQAIAGLRHRNIVIVYEYGQKDNWPYIAMEYIEGGTLNERLLGEPADWVKVTNLSMALADALDYAHRQGLVHRDVKPSNVLMAQDDWPLLADFGLVKLPDTEFVLTGTGVRMGTPAYLAPEQARGVNVTFHSDMYSLGVLMFEMVTGRLPFNYANPNKVMLAHISEPPPHPRQFNPDCPAGLEDVILTALQKSPQDRYGDMRAMVKAMEDVLSSSKERPTFYKSSPPAAAVPSLEARLFLVEQRVNLPLPDKENIIIGRTYRSIIADIDLGPYGATEAGVSRQHARLTRTSEAWVIDDLNSLNGTFVNEVRVSPGQTVSLKNGDLIRCSHLSLLFLTSAQS
jgi:serine/threonine protein kinase